MYVTCCHVCVSLYVHTRVNLCTIESVCMSTQMRHFIRTYTCAFVYIVSVCMSTQMRHNTDEFARTQMRHDIYIQHTYASIKSSCIHTHTRMLQTILVYLIQFNAVQKTQTNAAQKTQIQCSAKDTNS